MMFSNAALQRRRFVLSLKKSFDLPVYAEQMASTFVDFVWLP